MSTLSHGGPQVPQPRTDADRAAWNAAVQREIGQMRRFLFIPRDVVPISDSVAGILWLVGALVSGVVAITFPVAGMWLAGAALGRLLLMLIR